MRRPWWVGIALLGAALLLWPSARRALLLQNAVGSVLPFVLYTVAAWAPLAYLEWRARRPEAPVDARARRDLAAVPAALWTLVSVETLIDPFLTRWMGFDFTGPFSRLEGGFFPSLQDALRVEGIRAALDHAAVYLYAYGYIVVYGLMPAWAALRAPFDVARPLLNSIVLAWIVGFASFLAFPVNEPWTTSAAIENVMHERIPVARENVVLQWAVNNEFPSMHVAVTFAVAGALWHRDRRTLAWISPIVLAMPIVVVYLGIHWVSDAVAGILLGIASAHLVNRGWAPLWAVRPKSAKGTTASPPPKQEPNP